MKKEEIAEFILDNPDHYIVKELHQANNQRNRIEFHKSLQIIRKHLYATWIMKTECNCIDCRSGKEEAIGDLLI